MKGVIRTLVWKEVQLDWRQKNPLVGILLYTVSTIYVVYLSFNQVMTPKEWSTTFWIIVMFIASGGLNRSFSQEYQRRVYYYFTVPAGSLIGAKLFYSVLYLLVLTLTALLTYMILLPAPELNWGLFALNLLVAVVGIAASFTFIASISAHTGQGQNMLAILGFPVLLPVLFLAIGNASALSMGGEWADIDRNLLILAAIDAIIISLSLILFPYTWRP